MEQIAKYHSQRNGEPIIDLGSAGKFQHVNAFRADGVLDIGTYSFREDRVYDYRYFQNVIVPAATK